MSQKERDAYVRAMKRMWAKTDYPRSSDEFAKFAEKEALAIYPDEPPAQSSAEGGLREALEALRDEWAKANSSVIYACAVRLGNILAAQPAAQTPAPDGPKCLCTTDKDGTHFNGCPIHGSVSAPPEGAETVELQAVPQGTTDAAPRPLAPPEAARRWRCEKHPDYISPDHHKPVWHSGPTGGNYCEGPFVVEDSGSAGGGA